MTIEAGPIRYLGWIANFDSSHYTVQGFGDTQSEALLMLRAAWATHCQQNHAADPHYLDEYLDDVNYQQIVIPSGVVEGTVVTTLPGPPPTLADIVAFANDEQAGEPVRNITDDEVGCDYGNAWRRPSGEVWHHSPDVFSYDEVCTQLTRLGVQAYVEQTGGGCATIYAGPLVPFEHASFVNGVPTGEVEIEMRYKIAAGPGAYGWDLGDSVGYLGEFWVGPNDDGESGDGNTVADLAPTSTRQVAALIALYVIDSADFDNVTAIGLDATQRGIPQNGA